MNPEQLKKALERPMASFNVQGGDVVGPHVVDDEYVVIVESDKECYEVVVRKITDEKAQVWMDLYQSSPEAAPGRN